MPRPPAAVTNAAVSSIVSGRPGVADPEAAVAFYSRELGLAAERLDEWRRHEVPFPSVRVDAAINQSSGWHKWSVSYLPNEKFSRLLLADQ